MDSLSHVIILDNKLEISGFIIERTAKRMRQNFQQMLKEANTNITFDQWLVLQVLHKGDGISQLQIAQETNKDAPTITRIIDLLCKKRLLQRDADQSDRRKFKISLTPQGHQKIKSVLPLTKTFRAKAWDGLSNTQMQQLEQSLNMIFDNLK